MARLNNEQLIMIATGVAAGYRRARVVEQDPAVRTGWREAAGAVAAAGVSISKAARETLAAWRRTGGGAATVTRIAA